MLGFSSMATVAAADATDNGTDTDAAGQDGADRRGRQSRNGDRQSRVSGDQRDLALFFRLLEVFNGLLDVGELLFATGGDQVLQLLDALLREFQLFFGHFHLQQAEEFGEVDIRFAFSDGDGEDVGHAGGIADLAFLVRAFRRRGEDSAEELCETAADLLYGVLTFRLALFDFFFALAFADAACVRGVGADWFVEVDFAHGCFSCLLISHLVDDIVS